MRFPMPTFYEIGLRVHFTFSKVLNYEAKMFRKYCRHELCDCGKWSLHGWQLFFSLEISNCLLKRFLFWYVGISRWKKVNNSISCGSFLNRRCDFSVRANVVRHGPKNLFCAHHETHWDDVSFCACHAEMSTLKRKTHSLRKILRHDHTHKSRCAQWKFSPGTAFFSYFFLIVESAFCGYQALFFSHREAPLQASFWLFFMRDMQKICQDRGNWWSMKFSKKNFFRNIHTRVESDLDNVFCEIQNIWFSLPTWSICMWTCISTWLPCPHKDFFLKHC